MILSVIVDFSLYLGLLKGINEKKSKDNTVILHVIYHCQGKYILLLLPNTDHLEQIDKTLNDTQGVIRSRKSTKNRKYYTLRFYFPYLSLLAQPVNIFVYGPGPINIMFSYGFCPNSFFVLDIQ